MFKLPLSTREKEELRDRIDELKLIRQRYYDWKKIVVSLIIGIGAIWMGLIAIYFPQKEIFSKEIIWGSVTVLIMIIILIGLTKYSYKKEKFYNIKIKKNFDALLGRKIKKQ